jgi:hypothetical protein
MNRPLMQHGVAQLEQLFASSKSDTKVLKQLENELRYRQVPRAVSLLSEVQAALYVSPDTSKTEAPRVQVAKALAPPGDSGSRLKAPPVQPPLWSTPVQQSADTGPKPSQAGAIATGTPAISSLPKAGQSGTSEARQGQDASAETPLVTLAEAFRLLKATPSSSWESVEQTRRQGVQASSPSRLAGMTDHQGKEAREQARRLNAAYEVLSRARAASG